MEQVWHFGIMEAILKFTIAYSLGLYEIVSRARRLATWPRVPPAAPPAERMAPGFPAHLSNAATSCGLAIETESLSPLPLTASFGQITAAAY